MRIVTGAVNCAFDVRVRRTVGQHPLRYQRSCDYTHSARVYGRSGQQLAFFGACGHSDRHGTLGRVMRSLASHTAAYTLASALSRATVLVWLIVLPFFLPASDYGVLGLIITMAALVNLLVPLEISQALARYYPSAEPLAKRAYLSTAWTFTLAMLAIVAVTVLIASVPLCQLVLGDLRYLTIFRLAVLFFVFNTVFYFIQSQFRWDFRTTEYTVVTLVFAFVTLVLSLLFAITLPDALLGVIVGQLIGAGTGVALGLWRLRTTLGLGIDGTTLKNMLHFSLPLVPASLAIFLSTYASRFILLEQTGLEEVGLFTWASQIALVPPLLLLGFQAAVTPLVMKLYREPGTKHVLARAFEAVLALELCLCLAVGLLTPHVIAAVGYSAYAAAGPLVIILAPAYLMLQLYVFAPGFAISERTDLQLMVAAASAVTAVAGNYLLIGVFGLKGAAFATLAAAALFLGSWFWFSQSLYPLPVRWTRIAVLILLFASFGVMGTAIIAGVGLSAVAIKAALIVGFVAAAFLCGLVRFGDLISLLRRKPVVTADPG